jgi:hypothetical protein
MILIAAMNRGWRLDRKPDYMSRFDYWWNRFLAVVVPPFGKGDMILSVLQGAPFIVNLRLQWIRLERAAPDKMPRVVQLDGTRDDMIRSEDHHDLHAGHRFVQLKVHGAGHLDIVRFDEKLIGTWLHKLFYYLGRAALWICTLGRRKSAPVFGVRRETFVKALTSDPAQLDSDFPSQFKTDGGVDWVVFTVHGIRDFGHWTAGVEAAARQIGQSGGPQIVTARPRYNWFPMIDFLIGFRRRRNVEWLMDEYSTALATYPRADVSFIGHSNGTYLLSSALWRYLGCEFKHVILVGSVIPRAFPWDRLVPARVTSVCNIIGTRDVVVAVFPKLFEQVSEWFLRTDRLKIDPLGKGWPGIGSGGFNGFRSLPHGVTEQYVPGGHGAGVDASYHQALVQLATRPDNEAPVTIASKKLAGPNAFVRMLSIWSPAIWILLAGGLAWAIWHSPLWFARIGLDWNEWFLRGIAAVIAYFILKVA